MRRARILANVMGERDPSLRARLWFGGIAHAERERLVGHSAPVLPPDTLPFSIATGSALRRTLFFDQTSWLPDNLLERGDRMMMAGGIEGRMPFMDTRLAAFAATLPDSFLLGERGGKRILRAAMRDVLPKDILSRKKVGFRVPFHAWFRDRLREPLRDMLLGSSAQIAKLCDRTTMQRFFNDHLEGRRNNERILWTLANLELFLQAYKPELDVGRPTLAEAAE
jgi:asparagine synthase (glutamine-hydrolysing)